MKKLEKILSTLPNSAGIYQFFNIEKKIIYIWKSVNLKSRVNSYFNWTKNLNFAKKQMVSEIRDIKYIMVENENESLILESNLIKKNLPKYNILMKDGKNYVYIKITNSKFPKIIKTRKWPCDEITWKEKKEIFFWPYISNTDVDNILKVLKKVFWYGVGQNSFFNSKRSYNLDKYLFPSKRSSGIDEQKVYFNNLEKIKKFLRWEYKETIKELEEKMLRFAKNQEFERADILKKQIQSIEVLNQKHIVREWIIWDFDVISYLEKFDKIFLWKIEIRDSKIIWFYPYEVENNLSQNIEEILKDFVKKSFVENILIAKKNKIPQIIISKQIEIDEETFNKLDIAVPQKWLKLDLIKMCYKNTYEFAYKKHIDSLSTKSFSKATMKNILFKLNFVRINKNIVFECNDISHLSGTHTVASRSVIENWKTANSKYRKYRIKSLKDKEINDFDSMRELISRRLIELEKTWDIPDLIVIDWWKPQLSSVYEELNKSELKDKIQIVSIAKKEEILYTLKDWNYSELILDKNSPELRLLQKIRDEAHRFAISFNRESRNKAMKKNILESLPGIWIKTRKKILKEFGSIENLAKQEKEYLESKLNKNIINILEEHGII